MSPVRASYVKSTAVCLAGVIAGILGGVGAVVSLSTSIGIVVGIPCAFVAVGAATLASSCATVLKRHSRGERGEVDLFLELNRSREPAAIAASPQLKATRLRRWAARRLLGHDNLVGDLVEVKSWAEIRA